jgi:hypothetical protein
MAFVSAIVRLLVVSLSSNTPHIHCRRREFLPVFNFHQLCQRLVGFEIAIVARALSYCRVLWRLKSHPDLVSL